MKRIMAVLAVMLAGVPGHVRSGSPADSRDEEMIRAICLERVAQFNRHEGPFAADFTADADFVNVYGMWRKGAGEIASRQGDRAKTVLRSAKMSLTELRIRFVRPDVAVVHQTHQITGMLGPDGHTLPPQKERALRVMVKEQGKWLTTAFHNTIVRDGSSPASAR